MGTLFRDEVLDAQRSQWLGTINLATPLAFRWWSLLAAALVVALLALLVFGQYTRRETVAGQLLPTAGILTLSAKVAGTVANTRVHEGERVVAGQALVDVSGDLASASMGDTHAVISDQLRAQQREIRATLAGLDPQVAAQGRDMRSRIGMLHAQVAQIDGQLELQRQQAAVATHLVEKIKPLNRSGFISGVEFDQYSANALAAQGQIKTLERERLDAQQQQSALTAQLAQLPLDISAKANQLHGQLAELDAQLAESESQRRSELSAPQAGVVSTLLVKPGQTVAAGQPLLSILPRNSELEAQLLVPSSAIGFVTPGNRVVLRYQAYPYQKFGQQFGKIVQVSRSALNPAEVGSLVGRNVDAPLYRVLVALDRQTIDGQGEAEALKPGMELQADILLDRRNLWQWVFEPVYGLHAQLATSGSHRL